MDKTRSSFASSGFLLLAAVLMVMIVAFDANGQTANVSFNPGETVEIENYKIGPGDVLDVSVTKNETLSRGGLRVSNDGMIQLPMLDHDLPVACLTERETADVIKEKYKKYLIDPNVNVSVKEFNSSPVAVIGAINSPGRFQLQRSIRLVELLTLVNGPSANAGKTVEIIRNPSRPVCKEGKLASAAAGGEELISLTLDDAFKGTEASNPVVMAGDIIRIAQASEENAYIQGNVKSSLAIKLKDPVTLTQAIAMAGGFSEGAQTEKVKIRRQIPGSLNREEMLVNVKEINQRKRDDVLLQPNDIIEVSGPSGGKKIFQDIIKTIVPSLTRLPMSVIPF